MYQTMNLGQYGGLGKAWGDAVDSSHFIPKPHPNVNSDEASDVLRNFPAKPFKLQIKGDVYWGTFGPAFSQKPLLNGKIISHIAPPKTNSPPFIIPGNFQGISDNFSVKTCLIILGVLSLIILVVRR